VEIVVDNVTFAYAPDVVALKQVSISIEPGETVAIIGENGAGKSTLAKHLNGLLRPSEGRVTVGGWDTREQSAAEMAARVAFAFQNPDDQLFKRSVQAEVAFGPQNLGFSDDEVAAAVAEALEMTGLSAEAEAHPHDLHNSQRRWVALAATLAMRAPIVVIDEPTIGQDASGVEKLGQIIDQLRDGGRTIIAISHQIDFCASNFARIVVMAGGRILADGSPQAVFSEEALLAEAHVEAPQIARLAAKLEMPHGILDKEAFLQVLKKRQA
jgi:energy-coupling factor transport system ATP-binding protein